MSESIGGTLRRGARPLLASLGLILAQAAAAQGQPAAKTVVDQAARALGRLIAAVANLTMCYHIIITGEGARLAEAAGEAMQQQVTADRDPAAAPLYLQTPHLTPDDWAQGPAVLAIQTLVRPAR